MKEESCLKLPATDNAEILELKGEHGSMFVDGMVEKGKKLLFSGEALQTIFQKEHLVALRYALTSMGIHAYNTIYSFVAKERRLVFHFNAEDMARLKEEQHSWKGK